MKAKTNIETINAVGIHVSAKKPHFTANFSSAEEIRGISLREVRWLKNPSKELRVIVLPALIPGGKEIWSIEK